MSTSFFRRHKLFLSNIAAGSTLLTLGDFCAQKLFDKKNTLDEKRLRRFFILSYIYICL